MVVTFRMGVFRRYNSRTPAFEGRAHETDVLHETGSRDPQTTSGDREGEERVERT